MALCLEKPKFPPGIFVVILPYEVFVNNCTVFFPMQHDTINFWGWNEENAQSDTVYF